MASRRKGKFRSTSCLVIICFLRSHFSITNNVAHALSGTALSLVDRVRLTMKLSERGTSNITAAEEACTQWADIFRCEGKNQLSPSVILLCLELHAACLVRVGNDDEALMVFDDAEALSRQYQIDGSIRRLHLGKAKSLQRLLRYKEAYDEFCRAGGEDGIIGGITCALRQGNISAAHEAIKFSSEFQSGAAMHNAITFFDGKGNDLQSLHAASCSSLLCRWLLCVASERLETTGKPLLDISSQEGLPFTFLDLCKLNTGPFDDPMLVHLDDKVMLHRLLTSTPELADETKSFWPQGWILSPPRSLVESNEPYPVDSASLFILKRRAGYGSHGNRIAKGWPDIQRKTLSFVRDGELILVQRMVENPLLISSGFKFSLRLYVALIDDAVFLSDVGLVKLAAEPVRSEDISARSHMTNSGREQSMRQETLEYLKQQLSQQKEHSWDDLFSSLKQATGKVFTIYKDMVANNSHENIELSNTRRMVSKMKIPKILGLDFVVDNDLRPWLVEINRFPGLEPRDLKQDADVKHTIVRDTWQLAVSLSFSGSHVVDWLDSDLRRFSHDLPTRNSFTEVL